MSYSLKIVDFYDMNRAISKHMEEKYGIRVETCDVVDPNTGDFDGTKILIDYAVEPELQLFILLHLFGHTVQWNVSDELRKLGMDSAAGNKTEEELDRIFEYERDGTRLGIKLMNDAGIVGMDRWASDWFHTDWKYLKHFYLTGEKLDPNKLFNAGEGDLLTPLDIPAFKPQKFVSRYSF